VAVETAAAFTEKLALLDPAATVMDDGIVIAATGVPSLSATFAPVLDAGCVRVTVQVEVPGVRTVAGVHTSAWIAGTGGRSDSKKLAELPLRLATTMFSRIQRVFSPGSSTWIRTPRIRPRSRN
jgi:hypothetical protein